MVEGLRLSRVYSVLDGFRAFLGFTQGSGLWVQRVLTLTGVKQTSIPEH